MCTASHAGTAELCRTRAQYSSRCDNQLPLTSRPSTPHAVHTKECAPRRTHPRLPVGAPIEMVQTHAARSTCAVQGLQQCSLCTLQAYHSSCSLPPIRPDRPQPFPPPFTHLCHLQPDRPLALPLVRPRVAPCSAVVPIQHRTLPTRGQTEDAGPENSTHVHADVSGAAGVPTPKFRQSCAHAWADATGTTNRQSCLVGVDIQARHMRQQRNKPIKQNLSAR